METIKKWISHNQATFVAMLGILALVSVFFGCQPQVVSPYTGEKVGINELHTQYENRIGELQLEIEKAKNEYSDALLELERQAAMLEKMLELASVGITAAVPGYGDLATGVLGVLALGLGIDNRRKDGVIAGKNLHT